MPRRKSAYQPANLAISVHLKAPYAAEVAAIAQSLGITRHRLLLAAVYAGLEKAIEQLHAEQTAPQPAPVKPRRKKIKAGCRQAG